MNKRVVILLGILAVLITAFLFKEYLKTLNQLKEEYQYSTKIIKTAKEIEYLKTRFKPIIPRYCKANQNDGKITLTCDNLNSYKLREINRILKNSKIISLNIEKNKTLKAVLEIEK